MSDTGEAGDRISQIDQGLEVNGQRRTLRHKKSCVKNCRRAVPVGICWEGAARGAWGRREGITRANIWVYPGGGGHAKTIPKE